MKLIRYCKPMLIVALLTCTLGLASEMLNEYQAQAQSHSNATHTSAKSKRKQAALLIIEAWLHHMIAKFPPDTTSPIVFVSLAPNDKTLSINELNEMLSQRFNERTPVILSDLSRLKVVNGTFKDRKTGRQAVEFSIISLKWHGKTDVILHGSWQNAGTSGCISDFTLISTKGKWSVTKEIVRGRM